MEPTTLAIAPCEKGSASYSVKRCRERAEELRTIAEDLRTASCRDTLTQIADTYDQIAERAAGLPV